MVWSDISLVNTRPPATNILSATLMLSKAITGLGERLRLYQGPFFQFTVKIECEGRQQQWRSAGCAHPMSSDTSSALIGHTRGQSKYQFPLSRAFMQPKLKPVCSSLRCPIFALDLSEDIVGPHKQLAAHVVVGLPFQLNFHGKFWSEAIFSRRGKSSCPISIPVCPSIHLAEPGLETLLRGRVRGQSHQS